MKQAVCSFIGSFIFTLGLCSFSFNAMASHADMIAKRIIPTLTNGVLLRHVMSIDGNDVWFKFYVPKDAIRVKFELSDGIGDADMYVRFNHLPDDNAWDCRSMMAGNDEQCVLSRVGGAYYIRLKSFVGFSGVSIKASFQQVSGKML